MDLRGLFGLVIVLSALLIIVWLYMTTMSRDKTARISKKPEWLENIVEGDQKLEPSVDRVDFNHDDPKFSKYSRMFRDAMGMDGSDYYYENDTMYRQGVADEKHGERLFESEYGLPDTRGYDDHPYNPDDRWIGDRMSGSVESAEPLIGGSITSESMTDRQIRALFGPNSAESMSDRQVRALFGPNTTEKYASLTNMSQADVLFA